MTMETMVDHISDSDMRLRRFQRLSILTVAAEAKLEIITTTVGVVNNIGGVNGSFDNSSNGIRYGGGWL